MNGTFDIKLIAQDKAGNKKEVVYQIRMDTNPPDISATAIREPAPSLLLTNGMIFSKTSDHISWISDDPGHPAESGPWYTWTLGVDKTYFSYKRATDTVWFLPLELPYSDDTSATGGRYGRWSWFYPLQLLPADEIYDIKLMAQDKVGNIREATYQIMLDITAPLGSVKINNNATYTNNVNVTLNLSATDAVSGMDPAKGAQMQFSNDNATWSLPEGYATTKAWTLPTGFGTGIRTVYIKYKDAAGNWSGAFSDGIILDTTAPTTPVVTDAGSTTTSKTTLTASWTSSDPDSGIVEYQYRITRDSTSGTVIRDWTSTGTSKSVTASGLSLTVGSTYYFSVKAKNGAGLRSVVIGYSDGIKVVN
jgi:hypothetical protein